MTTVSPAISRRLLPLLVATPAFAQPLPTPRDYRWRVTRNGTAIGYHHVGFSRRGDDLVTSSEVVVTPRVLGVVVYRFEHRYTEVTRGSQFVSVSSRQNRNGRIVEVEAERTPRGVAIHGSEGERLLPPDAAPLSWWQPQRFGGAVPVFGTTTGKLMELRWTREALGAGGSRWHVTGEVEATLDFAADGRWTAYQVKGDDGSMVVYEAE
ncbi:DUF6134 family protein [Roseococcus pinisoli]|uniref:Uncharacterized protein n=1 Tax=Roseococcus pinisoli TaxID=2835040 RepID=A0ABS5QCL6_9PROT|nr:DUF6134 family protein [Roseococcus pinisoli]MBS7811420.1 hypothetical protein [Roseococcus pinisoli]